MGLSRGEEEGEAASFLVVDCRAVEEGEQRWGGAEYTIHIDLQWPERQSCHKHMQ